MDSKDQEEQKVCTVGVLIKGYWKGINLTFTNYYNPDVYDHSTHRKDREGGMAHITFYYTSPQSLIITFSWLNNHGEYFFNFD